MPVIIISSTEKLISLVAKRRLTPVVVFIVYDVLGISFGNKLVAVVN